MALRTPQKKCFSGTLPPGSLLGKYGMKAASVCTMGHNLLTANSGQVGMWKEGTCCRSKCFFWPDASSCRNANGHCYFVGRWASTTPAVSWRGALTDDAEEVVQILATLVAQHDLILRV